MVLRTCGGQRPLRISLARVFSRTLLLTCLLLPLPRARGQVFQISNPGTGSVAVEGQWQFHTGDDSAWAGPAYNDSGWEQLRADDTWGAQTHPGYTGFAWYRKRIAVAEPAGNLSILIPPVEDAYEIYWNGKKIGTYGGLPPHAAWRQIGLGRATVYPLGPAPLSGVLALRVWKAPLSSSDPSTIGGLVGPPMLGDPAVLAMQAATPRYLQAQQQLPQTLISTVMLVAGLLTLLLFLRDRTEWLYLWLGAYLLASGLFTSIFFWGGNLHFIALNHLVQFLQTCQDISLWLLLLTLFGFSGEIRWRRWATGLAILYVTAQLLDAIMLSHWQFASAGMQWTDAITTAIYQLAPIYILFIVGFGLARRKRRMLWPLAITVFLFGIWTLLYENIGQGQRFTHWKLAGVVQALGLHLGGYTFSPLFLLDTLLFIVLIFTVAQQQIKERRHQMRIDTEIQSAREVQQVLVPEDVPAVPGFSIASIYKPAAELGGDFYQVIPLEQGGALIVVGDVSGKGFKAAMVVSLIVGSLRTLADFTREPAEILQGLNRRLIGRTQGGFATCVAMRIEPDGSAAIATAGHFSPLRDGQELPLEGALPLGIVADVQYDQILFRMQENETLTFYTDGIVEARNGQGELFGFERISEMSRTGSSVIQVAEDASAFGQDDDITVLTLTRLAAGDLALASSVQLTTQIAAG
ncbi:MAG: PP2C family protein-serine/threonine phosphatase [Acidobacteriota bacterium]